MNETKLTWPPALPFSTVLARAMDQPAVSLLYQRSCERYGKHICKKWA